VNVENAPPPPAKAKTRPRITNEHVADMLASCLAGRPNYISPDEGRVNHLTQTINRYIQTPWSVEAVAKLHAQAKVARMEGEMLRAAATLLRRDLEALTVEAQQYELRSITTDYLERRAIDIKNAIALLEEPRGDLDHPGLAIHLSTGPKGKPPAPWRLTAAAIADELIRTLRDCGDPRAGIGNPNGPVVKFVAICLRLISPDQKAPKRETIHEAIGAHLENSFKYRKGV